MRWRVSSGSVVKDAGLGVGFSNGSAERLSEERELSSATHYLVEVPLDQSNSCVRVAEE